MPITLVFCGKEYYEAIPVLLLNAPVIVFISLTNLMGIQILYPQDKIKIVIWSVSGGAVMNLIFNLLLIPLYGATGAAISTLIAEFAVLLIQIIYGREYYPFKVSDMLSITYIIGCLIMGSFTYISIYFINSIIAKLVVGTIVGVISYTIFLMLSKDPLITEVELLVKNKLCHARKTV